MAKMGMWIGRLVDWAQEVSQGALQFTGNFDTHQNEGLSWCGQTQPNTSNGYLIHQHTRNERDDTNTSATT